MNVYKNGNVPGILRQIFLYNFHEIAEKEEKFYTERVHTKRSIRHRWWLLAAASMSVAACSATPPAANTPVSGAVEGAYAVLPLIIETSEEIAVTPVGGLLGVHATTFLGTEATRTIHAALDGVTAVGELARAEDTSSREGTTFQLLEYYGQLLSLDLMDTLNRSQNRAATLNDYVETLRDVTTQVEERKERLEEERDALDDRRREQSRTVAALEREARTALQNNAFERAGSNQEELQKAEAALAQLESQVEERRNLLTLINRLVPTGEERLQAIERNREVLIAGLKVVEVPGIEDLGLIEEGDRR